MKSVKDSLSIPLVKEATAAISEALDKLIFSVLSVFVSPVLEKLREILGTEKDNLTEKEKREVSNNKKESIFDSGSKASDPTHSQLAKDHFDTVLNTPAGEVTLPVCTN